MEPFNQHLNTIRIELWAKHRAYKQVTLTNETLHEIKRWVRQHGRNADYALFWLFGAYGWKKRTILNVIARWDFRPLESAYHEAVEWQAAPLA